MRYSIPKFCGTPIPPTFYIFAEDMVSVIVGPFQTREEANSHIEFCKNRGDSAEMEVISNFILDRMDSHYHEDLLSPEEDRNFKID